MNTNIIVDTDMGNDDIIAICALLKSKKFNVKAFSTVFGVTTQKVGANNLSKLLAYINLNIPICRGKSKAVKSNWNASFPKIDQIRASNLTLLNTLNIPLNIKTDKNYISLDLLYKFIQNESEKITFVCLGPLTNLAYLLNKYQNKLTDKIKQIFIMGGAINTPGIVPPLNVSEYNIYLDPEGAKTVFDSNIKLTIFPIDATKWVPAMLSFSTNQNKKILNRFLTKVKQTRPNNKLSQIIKELIINNNNDFNYFYDPLVSACMENTQLMEQSKTGSISVSLSKNNRGRTTLAKNFKANTQVISKINSRLLYQQILSLIKK
jgi:inosine-uridine nucleoside N-ribohydrolase